MGARGLEMSTMVLRAGRRGHLDDVNWLQPIGVAVREEALAGVEELPRPRGAGSTNTGSKVIPSENAGLEAERGALVAKEPQVEGRLQHFPEVEETHGALTLRGRRERP